MRFLRRLKKKWPGLHVVPETDTHQDTNESPRLVALHIVWPWSTKLMKTLSSSIFCDATFKVTIYHYSVVAITTLDGNQQHRPLMCSFIINSTGSQWATIFDIFHRVVQESRPVLHVVTSDQEEAIRSGLNMSQLSGLSVHFFCSLHIKWNVRDHK